LALRINPERRVVGRMSKKSRLKPKKKRLIVKIRESEPEEHLEPLEVDNFLDYYEALLISEALRLDKKRIKDKKRGRNYVV